jgi:hypothetical protein
MELPLGEALDGLTHKRERRASRTERQRHWEEEHDYLANFWCENEHQKALAEFRRRAEAAGWTSRPVRDIRLKEAVSEEDH